MKYINGVQKPLASDTINTPAGNIAAADVQTAVNELDTEKLALAGGTMTGDLTFSGAQKIIGGTSTTADLTLQTTSGVGAAGADMHFLVGNNGATEAVTILNSGNVGIGTTGSLSKLQVEGVNYAIGGAYNTYGNLFISTSDAEAINTGGSLTFGGVSSGATRYSYAGIFGKKETSGVGSALGYLAFATDDNNNLVERMRITSDGNVGIGQASPAGRLHVTGNADDEQFIVDFNATQSTVTQPVLFRNSAGSNLIAFTSLGGAVFNEQGNDADFRIEGDTNANLFFVDASLDSVVVGGSIAFPIANKTGAYTLTASDHTVTCNASSAAFIITLPTSVGITGRVYIIKKTDSSANVVTVDGNGSETIDGALTQALGNQWESITVQSDGTNWVVI